MLPIALFGWLEVVLVHVLSFRLLNDLRCELFERFRELAPAYFLERRSGDVTRTAMSDVELIEVFTSHLVPPFIVALVVPLLALVGLFLMHWALGLVVLPFVALVASVPSWLLRRADRTLPPQVRRRWSMPRPRPVRTGQDSRCHWCQTAAVSQRRLPPQPGSPDTVA